ncbi:MAG: cobalt-zinc-cadmium efflux system outer membrane protein [Verrucomicrobiales bacterium]|jgi:cobalt-zinc-cadmium efflux system outer membrane protein
MPRAPLRALASPFLDFLRCARLAASLFFDQIPFNFHALFNDFPNHKRLGDDRRYRPASSPLIDIETIQKMKSTHSTRQKTSRFAWSSVAIALALGALTGCQTYKRKPVDLSAHVGDWEDRGPAHEKVQTFAKRLGEASPQSKTFNPKDGLSLSEGETVALVYNPDLRIARLRADVAKATAEYAGLWDDPQLSIDVLNITSNVPDPWVVGSALAFTIPISGRLQVEKARAEAAMHAELERVAESEWTIVRDLRENWLSWSAERYRFEQTEAVLTELDSIIESTNRLAEGGEMPRTEAALFVIERESRRTELARLKGEVAEGEQQLRALLGLSPKAPLNLVPALSAVRDSSAKEEPSESNLTLARLLSEYEVAEQTLLREIKKQYPDLTFGAQGESDEGQSRIGFVGAIPIPILNSNKGGIAEARAERELARAAYETGYERVAGRIAALQARLQGIRSRRKSIDETLVPLVDRQIADARQLLELGEGGSLVLLESLLRAHEAKMTLIDTQLDDAKTNSEIRYLLGLETRD